MYYNTKCKSRKQTFADVFIVRIQVVLFSTCNTVAYGRSSASMTRLVTCYTHTPLPHLQSDIY